MKKFLLIATVWLLLMPQTAFANFPDIESENSKTAIEWLADNGVVKGYADGTFRPDAPVNRAEFLKMLTESTLSFILPGDGKNCTQLNENGYYPERCTYGKTFPDVPLNTWFAPYVYWTALSGYPDGTFKPEQNVNYAEAVKMLQRVYDIVPDYPQISLPTAECTNAKYADIRSGDHLVDHDAWYYPYIQITDALCISDFGSNAIGMWGGLDPSVYITRGDMAEFIYRTKAVVDNSDPINRITYSENLKPKALTFCRGEFQVLENGRQVHPIAPEYQHLEFLGQIFTASTYCYNSRTNEIYGVSEEAGEEIGFGGLTYSLDSTINLIENPSEDFIEIIEDVGYTCDTDLIPCDRYTLDPRVVQTYDLPLTLVSKLLQLKNYSHEIISDECSRCSED